MPPTLPDAIGRLARSATTDFTVDDMLRELCEAAVAALPVDGAGVMVAENSTVRFVHARPANLCEVEQLQELVREGPCQDSIAAGRRVVVVDLAADDRWPQFRSAALQAGLRAVVAVPLRSRGRSWGSVDLYRHAPGEWTGEELAATELLADVAVSYVVMATDRDAAQIAQRELARRSMTDELTGLPNRALLFDRAEHALASARRSGRPVAAFFIDLDGFKEINDGLGHGAGDAVLVEVADRLSAILRDSDTLARLAGDEFVLLCEDLPDDDDPALRALLETIAGRVRTALDRPVHVDGADISVTASVGVTWTRDAPDVEQLLRGADNAMYAAKREGRDRVVVQGGVRQQALGADGLAPDLAVALEHGELRVHYQPIVETTSGRVEAVEALLRWAHPERGELPAVAFVAIAEATGVLPRIGQWVIEEACTQLRTWQDHLGDKAPETVFCNVSPRELLDPGLVGVVTDALSANRLEPRHLGLEILEQDFTDTQLVSVLGTYQAAGHPLSVDDFGTGFSSLSRLIHLPVAYAKIDQSFVAGLPGDARARALIDAVVVISETLGLRLICEGVETQDQADTLTAASCHLLQGFHLARPMSAEDLTDVLTSRSQTRQVTVRVPERVAP